MTIMAEPNAVNDDLWVRIKNCTYWFHSIELASGFTTKGVKSIEQLNHELQSLHLPDLVARLFWILELMTDFSRLQRKNWVLQKLLLLTTTFGLAISLSTLRTGKSLDYKGLLYRRHMSLGIGDRRRCRAVFPLIQLDLPCVARLSQSLQISWIWILPRWDNLMLCCLWVSTTWKTR